MTRQKTQSLAGVAPGVSPSTLRMLVFALALVALFVCSAGLFATGKHDDQVRQEYAPADSEAHALANEARFRTLVTGDYY